MVINQTIYIKLLNEGTDVWRPTIGKRIEGNIFEVLTTEDYDPDDEEWEFTPGSTVKCIVQSKNLSENKI
jgi:hypothetical protein